MPERILTTICGLLVLIGLSACDNGREAALEPLPEAGIGSLTIDRHIPEGEPRPLGELSSPDDLNAFRKAYRHAEKIPGALKMTAPDYEIRFASGGEEKTFWLWSSPKGEKGMLMDTSDTLTGYAVDADSKDDLRRRIESIPYGWEQSKRYGDIAQGPSGTLHIEKWQAFLKRIDQRQPASVQIALYTDEGDPVFENMNYDGHSIHYLYDNSLDAYGLPEKRSTTCEKIVNRPKFPHSDEPMTEYVLYGCSGAGGGTFNLLLRNSDLEASRSAEDGVTVRRGLPGGESDNSVYGRLEDGSALRDFLEAYATAKKTNAEPDLEAPDYEASFTAGKEHKRVLLWFGNEGSSGMLADVSDSGRTYAELTPSSAERLYKRIMEIPYDPERASENGDLVAKPSGELINLDKWKDFRKALEAGSPASVHIVSYTPEGDPVFEDLLGDGNVIRYRYDSTHDAFGTAEKQYDTCEKIVDLPLDEVPGSRVMLDGCSGERDRRNKRFELTLPAEPAGP
ncbi:DUF4362 domain-containing protein [Saccharibacillus alkalitolerans]|uniref:DUF4362 domain-containing protein n=1 Tax=Saccharibacillus alkalitolerans TaxID=2705290 RepID=A0ABX0F9Q9_9BACL|nr:DUF4362 domain-containing protein [Saccharibacillus alkalitolerans]NGZ77642.1 DUF4362 domain-containing protein [Saccharibacillus alkalitolerans]